MKEEKNHVGRPTNEEVAERKKEKLNKILTPILVVAIVLTLGVLTIQKFNTNNLKGASNLKSNSNLGIDKISGGDISTGNCKFSLRLNLKNKYSNKKIVVDKVNLGKVKIGKSSGDVVYKWSTSTTINAKSSKTISIPSFSITNFSSATDSDYLVVEVLFHISGDSKQYYNTTTYKIGNKLSNSDINKCKPATTLSASSKQGNHLTFNKIEENDFTIDGCKATIKISSYINDRANFAPDAKEVIIDSVEMRTSDGKKTLEQWKPTIDNSVGNKWNLIKAVFNLKSMPLYSENGKSYKVSFYINYHIYKDTQRYYQYIGQYNYTNKTSENSIKTCRNKATTKVTETAKDNSSFTLTCPSSAKVNQEFTCTTNKPMILITVTEDGLNKAYKSAFTTTLNDKTKVAKYTKPGVVTVTATYGNQKKTAKVNIIPVDDKLTINCTGSFKVNKDIKCTTNEAGVTISVPATNLKKGYTTSFTTTDKDKVKWVNYTKAGNYTIKATKGNRSNSLTIKISK